MSTVNIHKFTQYMGLSMIVKGISVSPLKLQKLLYYQQAWHMVFFGRDETLFDDLPQAWVNGPVYPEIFREYKGVVPGMCDHLSAEHFGVQSDMDINSHIQFLAENLQFTDNQIGLIDSVIQIYGTKTQNQLILTTHSELPWCEAREGLMPYERSEKTISLDTMYKYYKARHDRNRSKKS